MPWELNVETCPVDYQNGKHCINCGEANDWCKYGDHFQAGGGWSPRSFIFCTLLKGKVYVEPPQADDHPGNEIKKVLIPVTCPYCNQLSFDF